MPIQDSSQTPTNKGSKLMKSKDCKPVRVNPSAPPTPGGTKHKSPKAQVKDHHHSLVSFCCFEKQRAKRGESKHKASL